jgi:hypothetical protein
MNTINNITWTEKYPIKSFETDINNRVSVMSLCNFMQESAQNHASMHQFGYYDLISDRKFYLNSGTIRKECFARLALQNFRVGCYIVSNPYITTNHRAFTYGNSS